MPGHLIWMLFTVNPRILLVEGDPDIAAAVAEVLMDASHDVVTCSTLRESLGLIEDTELSVVLVDMSLPDGRGEDLLRRLKQERPLLPVVMMTSSLDVKRVVSCMRQGASDCLSKPFSRGELLSVVAREMDNASAISPLAEEEKKIIARALEATQWRVKDAAERLKIGRATIYRKMIRYGLSRPGHESSSAERGAVADLL